MNPNETLGHYRLTEKLGEGGMGEVYRALDNKLKRDVALKILPDIFANDPDRMARFGREARVLASLNHPNIAAIYGIEESDGKRAPGDGARRRQNPCRAGAARAHTAP